MQGFARRGPGQGRILPDFLLIGAPKAGSTTLHAWVAEHPFVEPSSEKEVHYFDYGYYHGEGWYRSHFPLAAERDTVARAHGRPFITGESTPTYLSHPWAPRRAARLLPEVMLLVVLRNPVDRAYSQYQMSVREHEEYLEFDQALEREEARLRPEIQRARRNPHHLSRPLAKQSYLYRGHYAEQLERWLSFYPRERFHVLRSEDLAERPEQALADVYAFLGLPPHQPARLPSLHTARYGSMAPATRSWLVEYFRPHNERLAELVGRDLGWDR